MARPMTRERIEKEKGRTMVKWYSSYTQLVERKREGLKGAAWPVARALGKKKLDDDDLKC